ncbi:MAG: zinc-binding dehydrogenase [Candidatus Poribacteria bacterium]|nr:zinc-binding dehydrogenase [Candidatus Poribacteria bacterium]
MPTKVCVSRFRRVGHPFETCHHLISLHPNEKTPDVEGILVKVDLAAICGSDLHTVSGRRSAPTPCILGHEAVGRIAQFLPDSIKPLATDYHGNPLQVGDRVTWSIAASCNKCDFCTGYNLPQKCERLFKYGHARSAANGLECLNGGFADYIYLRPGTAIFRLPDELDDKSAVSLNCAAATVMDGLRKLDQPIGDTAIVIGLGMLGLYTCAILGHQGWRNLIGIDINPQRAELATHFGATQNLVWSDQIHRQINQTVKSCGADLVVEACGNPAALTSALDWLRFGGQLLSLGYVYPQAMVNFSADLLVRKCLTVSGNDNYHPRSLGQVIDFVQQTQDRYLYSSLVGEVFPLLEIDQAFAQAKRQNAVRIAIAPNLTD